MTSPLQHMVIQLESESVDAIPLGILRGKTDGVITYLNRAARELIGPDLGVGASLVELRFAPESEGVVEANLRTRFDAHRATTYRLTYVRPDLRTHVHVQISGLPEYDADGTLLGSIGFVTDKTMDHANLEIHHAIGSATDWRGLLGKLDDAVRDVIAFESIVVSLISADRSALQIFYERPDRTSAIKPAWRWWPMPAFVAADLDSLLTTRPDDLGEMFSRAPYDELAKNDAGTREWLGLGFKHMLRKPVMLDGRLVALVTLMRMEDRAFSEIEVARLDQLPIGETVNIALAIEHRNELDFALKLISDLGRVAHSIAEVGRVLVEQIQVHFEWEHVSLFRVNYDSRTVSIVHQAADAGFRLSDDFTQSSDVGLLGRVVLSGKAVRIGDVHANDAYVQGIERTNSEMCLPIPGSPVRWILNVESSLGRAFASEEQAPVERLLEVAGLILDRTLALEFNKTVLECVADAVIQTTAQGNIQYVNPACATLLEQSRESIQGLHLSALLSSADGNADATAFVTELMTLDRVLPRVVHFGVHDATPIPVLLSGNALPPQIGGKVYVASDLRYRQQVQRMDALQDVFRQVATESRVPLALTSSFLEEFRRQSPAAEASDLVDKALRQLRRADLPLERVVRLAATADGQELPAKPTSLRDAVLRLLDGLPESHRRKVTFVDGAGDPGVMAARPELDFCVASLVAFLLQMKAQRDAIEIRIGTEGRTRTLDFGLVDPEARIPSPTRLQAKGDHERDFALSRPVLQSLMQRMGGSFELIQKDGLVLRLALAPAECA